MVMAGHFMYCIHLTYCWLNYISTVSSSYPINRLYMVYRFHLLTNVLLFILSQSCGQLYFVMSTSHLFIYLFIHVFILLSGCTY